MFKLFGGKKSQDGGYFLELKEESAPAVEPVKIVISAKKEDKDQAEGVSKAPAQKVDQVVVPPKVEEPKLVNFATAPIAQTLSRRLPGPSLNTFKELARQVNP